MTTTTADHRKRLRDDVIGDGRDRKLGGAGVIRDAGDEAADLCLVKEIEGLAKDVVENFDCEDRAGP
jgi:hypothetical protein